MTWRKNSAISLWPALSASRAYLAVVVPGLESVVLHGDEVEGDVVEPGFTGGHVRPL